MIFPFSFWGGSVLNNVTQTLQLNEDFTGWFATWNTVVENLELTEDFTGFWTAEWAAATENLELFEDFNSW